MKAAYGTVLGTPTERATLQESNSQNGEEDDVTLIPLSDLHHQRYTVYWETMAPGD